MWAYIICPAKRLMEDKMVDKSGGDIEQKYARAKQELDQAFKDFHSILKDKVLEQNKSVAKKNTEKDVVDKLYKAAVNVENLNSGEGVMSLCIIVIRELLKDRDRTNELEYQICSLRKDLAKIKNDLGIKDDKK